jgi:hypothetical protein
VIATETVTVAQEVQDRNQLLHRFLVTTLPGALLLLIRGMTTVVEVEGRVVPRMQQLDLLRQEITVTTETMGHLLQRITDARP